MFLELLYYNCNIINVHRLRLGQQHFEKHDKKVNDLFVLLYYFHHIILTIALTLKNSFKIRVTFRNSR